MEAQANEAGDVTAAEDIRQLRGLTERGESGDTGLCLCGCGETTKPKSNFVIGHDAKVKSLIERARRSLEQNPNAASPRLPDALVQKCSSDAGFTVAGYTAETIIDLADKVGVAKKDSSNA